MTEINWQVDASPAIDYFEKMLGRLLHFGPVFEVGRVALEAANAENFASHGMRVGGWAPLSPRTAAWKAENGFPPAPLVRTGRLLESLSSLRGSPNDVSAHQATFGTNVPYAKFHQYGTTRMPRRQIVFEPVEFGSIMARASVAHLLPDSSVSLDSIKAAF